MDIWTGVYSSRFVWHCTKLVAHKSTFQYYGLVNGYEVTIILRFPFFALEFVVSWFMDNVCVNCANYETTHEAYGEGLL